VAFAEISGLTVLALDKDFDPIAQMLGDHCVKRRPGRFDEHAM